MTYSTGMTIAQALNRGGEREALYLSERCPIIANKYFLRCHMWLKNISPGGRAGDLLYSIMTAIRSYSKCIICFTLCDALLLAVRCDVVRLLF